MNDAPLPMEIDCWAVRRLQEDGETLVLLDCREPGEFDIVGIDGAVQLPMSQLPQRADELQPHRECRIVVYCHLGGRSLHVANWLRGQGYDQAQSMTGGIDGWAEQIEKHLPRY
jgi:adenylyltransferase/sulfurtransferase